MDLNNLARYGEKCLPVVETIRNFEFHKTQGICRLTEEILDS